MLNATRCALLSVAFAFVLTGCVRSPGGVASSNIPLSQDGYTVLGLVAASDCKVNLFGVIPVSGGNHVADAMNKALGQIPGADALVNISVDRVSKFFILWLQTCTEVRATAVNVK